MGSGGLEAGEWIVRISIWLALLCYPAGPFGIVIWEARGGRLARLVWSLGCVAFVVHVASSFEVFYAWSHDVALNETARQVAELTGRRSGAGLYLNYLFTVIWVVDAIRWWVDAAGYRQRSWIGLLLMHGFFLFMIFNGTVVFEQGAVTFVGFAVTAVGGVGAWKAVRLRRAEVANRKLAP